MLRMLSAFIVIFSLSTDIYAATCATFRTTGADRQGCLPTQAEVDSWNQLAANVSGLDTEVTQVQTLVSALQSQVNAIQGGTGTGTTVTFPDLFNLTPEQGAQLGGSIMLVWAIAWVFGLIGRFIRDF